MAFSWHNHCLCRVGAWSRTSHARWTADVRNLTGRYGLGCSNRAVFSSVLSLVAFWQNRSREQPEPAPDRGTDQQNRRSTAELEQHSTAGHVCLRGNLPNICCLLKQRFNRPQASRHCQSAVDMNPERPDLRRTRCHCFVFVALLHPKCHTEWTKLTVASLSMLLPRRRLRVWGRSKFTKHSLTLQEKALHFFFWVSHYMLAVGDLVLVATFIELSLGCSDCRV